MPIVTISRGSFSGGRQLAETVARELGYRLVSRENLLKSGERYGVCEKKLAEVLEKPPGQWEQFRHERRVYLAFLQAALCDQARTDGLVYHGHAGHLLLRGVAHVVRVRLIAPMEYRVGAAMTQLGLDRDAAAQTVQRLDRERSRWTKFLYGIDWAEPANYDLFLNLGQLTVEGACSLVRTAVGLPEYRPTPESQQVLEELCLASRARVALACGGQTASAEVEVEAHGEVLSVRGKLSSDELIYDVVRVLEALPGVRRVEHTGLGLWTFA